MTPRRTLEGIAVGLALCGCSTLGTPASPAGPLPHGGTGQFRALNTSETTFPPAPAGITLMTGGRAVDDAMPIEGDLFYAAATFAVPVDGGSIDAATPPDAGAPSDASASTDAGPMAAPSIDWSMFAGRQIFRSRRGEAWGFAPGAMVFSATQAWEGGYVTDPWVVRHPSGRYLLYYAAAGGIGVASAASLDGPWTREGSAPILPTTSAGTPQRPSAISVADLEGAPDALMLIYYELAGTIRIASSNDGIVLHDLDAITIPPLAQRDDRDGNETSVGSPGAISVPTPAHRHVVRIYYESRRDNGTVLIGMLGSGDGVHFEQLALPVFAERDRQRPAPRYVDARTTVLYAWVPNLSIGAEIASITPAGVRVAHVTPPTF